MHTTGSAAARGNAAVPADLSQLTGNVAGPVVRPGDDDYAEETATFNLAMPQQPAVAVGATSAADVSAAVRFAGDHGLPVAVLATGHGPTLPTDGALLVNTSRMTGVRLDPAARTVRIEAGVRAQSLIDAAASEGLVGMTGSSPDVGVVGFVAGAGLSPFLGRREGYAADHVRALDLVTADGAQRHVSADQDSDLFWAVRGGKDNFGIITALELELFDMPALYGGGLFFAGALAGPVLHAFRDWVPTMPDTMTGSVALLRLPDLPDIPAFMRDQFVVHVRIAYLGPATEGERLIEPLRHIGPRIADTVTEMPYSAIATIHADPEQPLPYFESSLPLSELPDAAIDAILERAGPGVDSPINMIELRHLGGALSRPAAIPNAISARDTAYQLLCVAMGGPPQADALYAAEDGLLQALAPWQTSETTLNFLSARDAGRDRALTAFEPATLDRLEHIKRAYDPGNMFRLNHNIPPSPPA